MKPQISFFINFFIKNRSYSTIYTFKNYFTTVISAISFQFQQNKSYPNRSLGCPRVGPGRVYAQPATDQMTSGFRREDLSPTAKTHGSSRIGLVGRRSGRSNMKICCRRFKSAAITCSFSWIFAGFEQNPPDLSKKIPNFRWIWEKLTRSVPYLSETQ